MLNGYSSGADQVGEFVSDIAHGDESDAARQRELLYRLLFQSDNSRSPLFPCFESHLSENSIHDQCFQICGKLTLWTSDFHTLYLK